mmetsp:Transcript_88096/g.174836  ORF Transcript_88096/g.174836 Transcript_88096/m.174836 type:complete len:115 (-) Transcript_88096:976-1320(-)
MHSGTTCSSTPGCGSWGDLLHAQQPVNLMHPCLELVAFRQEASFHGRLCLKLCCEIRGRLCLDPFCETRGVVCRGVLSVTVVAWLAEHTPSPSPLPLLARKQLLRLSIRRLFAK